MNHETRTQILKNDITPPHDKVERVALRNGRRRILELLKTEHVLNTKFILEYSLAGHNFERNLEEQLKNERNL